MPLPERPHGTTLTLADGRRLRLRPIRPDDVEALRRGFSRLTPEQVRLRVFHMMTELSAEAAERLCNPDPDQEVAYVAVDAEGEIRGEARFHISRGSGKAEFGIIVDPSLTGMGVGRALMRKLLIAARRRGLKEVWGLVLTENFNMIDFSHRLGAQREPVADEPACVRVRFVLAPSRHDA